MSGAPVEVDCEERDGGWECRVSTGVTEHVVTVTADELARFTPGPGDARRLVEEAFRFLLAREPASSILRRFAISEIERYFPGFPDWISDRQN